MKNKLFTKNKGITLIALVITIIVLLILAGITIATLTGDNGLLVKAQEAKKASDEATEKENEQLVQLNIEAAIRANPSADNPSTDEDYELKRAILEEQFQKVYNDNTIIVTRVGNSFELTRNGKNYKIKSDYTLRELMAETGVYGKLESDGTLKLRATDGNGYESIYEGVIKNCTDNRENIKKIIIEEPIAPNAITFALCTNLTEIEYLENLHTENMTTMQGMFDSTSLKKINISSFDTSNITSIAGMFGSCRSITEIIANNLDTSNVTDMSGMFNGCTALVNLSVTKFDLSKVTNTSAMFNACNSLAKLDLSTWVNTSNVKNMNAMFQLSLSHKLTELNLGKNFTIGSGATYNNFLNNVNRSIHIICNADTAAKIGSSFTNVTRI